MKKTINLFWIGVFIFVMLGGLVTTEEVASAETANLCIISCNFVCDEFSDTVGDELGLPSDKLTEAVAIPTGGQTTQSKICGEICNWICKKKGSPGGGPPKIKPGAINLSTTHIYGFGNITNGTAIYLSMTNITNVSFNASEAFRLALVIPKEEYLVSLYDTVYCKEGINNTETCKVLLDADKMTKEDFVNDFNSTASGINMYENLSDEWELEGDKISNAITTTWQNDENVPDGSYFIFIPSSYFSFIGRVVTSSNGIWFKEGDNKRILVENQSLAVNYYGDNFFYESWTFIPFVNYAPNGDFERDKNGDNYPDNWTHTSTYGQTTWSTDAISGSHSIKYDTGAYYNVWDYFKSTPFYLTPGNYTFGFWMKGLLTEGSGSIDVMVIKGDFPSNAYYVGGVTVTSLTSDWGYVAVNISAEESNNYEIVFYLQDFDDYFYLDGITLYKHEIDSNNPSNQKYENIIEDFYNNNATPYVGNLTLSLLQNYEKPLEEYRVNNESKFRDLRAMHVIVGLANAMKVYNVPPPFNLTYNSWNRTGLIHPEIPNVSDYNTSVHDYINGISFEDILLYRTGYISEGEFLPQEPPNTTEANWTIYIGEVNIKNAGYEMNNITLYGFNETDVIVILPETKPELTLGNWSISFAPNESIKAGDNVVINATVFNFGTKNATNVIVKFYDGNPNSGGILIGSNTTNLGPLWFNDTTITWTASAGTHNIYVVVDPDNSIAEINESNNVAYKTITVEQTIRNYSWSDLYFGYATCNNPIYSADDGYVQVTLSQPFKFYDKEYSTIYVGTNGYMTFDGGSWQYWNIPQMFMSTKMIAVDAGDLVSTIHVCSTSNGIIIRWQGRHWGYSDNVDVQAILYTNGNIKTNLNNVGAIIGITGVSGGDGKYYTSLTTNNNLSYGLSLPYGNYSSMDSSFGYPTCNNPIYSADDGYVQVGLSQSFKFYDKEYSTIYIGTNGYITFDGGSWQWYNIPQMFMGTKMIAVDAGDLVSTIHVCSTSNGIIIRWQGRHYGYSDNVDVQAILYSNGNIKTNLNNVGAIIGVTGISRGDSKYYTSLTTNNNLSYVLFKPPDYSIK